MSKFKLSILPKGVDEKNIYAKRDEVTLVFADNDDRKKYIKNEARYCRREDEAHISAIYKKDRVRTKNALLAKRVEFAINSGFAGSGNTWVQTEKGV